MATKTATNEQLPIGGVGTNQHAIKGSPKVKQFSMPNVEISQSLRDGIHHLVRDEEDYEADRREIPHISRALTEPEAAQDLFRTLLAYMLVWTVGKSITTLLGGGGSE